jgi:lipid II:glycine glycyltransferase (peptidoglycan interpeptide bridge formation enzyme)
MVEQRIKKGFLTKRDLWFSEQPGFQIVNSYYQSPIKTKIPGMQRSSFYTIHLDLTYDTEMLLAKMGKGTSYEIRRAEREGVRMQEESSLEEFIAFFNRFAYSKGIEGTSLNYLQYAPAMQITSAYVGSELLVMHSYIQDSNRTRLCMSASRVFETDEENKKYRNLIGYANRYLHFQDMLLYKKAGKFIYDFGGYAKDTQDKSLEGINEFKLNFGGHVVEEFNYRPMWL